SGQLVHHRQRQTAERRAEAPQIRDQVRREKLSRVREETGQRHAAANRAGHEELALKWTHLGDHRPGPSRDVGHWRAPRAAAGGSATVACSLSWSARMYAAMAQRSLASSCAA